MDLLDRLLAHDAWTTARLLELAEVLSDRELDREFDLGLRTVRATLNHIVWNTEAWSGLMAGEPPAEREPAPAPSVEELTRRHERSSALFARVAMDVRDRGSWDETWIDVWEDPPRERTFGGAIAHVATHGMHHRAQVLFMLRRLGVSGVPEGDVLSWESQRVP